MVAAFFMDGLPAAGSGIKAMDLAPSHCGALFGALPGWEGKWEGRGGERYTASN